MFRKILSVLFILSATAVSAQKNFVYTPEKPQAGETIQFTYEPGGDLRVASSPIEVVAYLIGSRGDTAQEIVLNKEGDKYRGKIHTDRSQYFLYLVFSAAERYDYNDGNGYWIKLYDGEKEKKGVNWKLAQMYGNYNSAGIEHDNEKSRFHMEQELSLYPESRKEHITGYLKHIIFFEQKKGMELVQKEIEVLLKDGLKSEADYELVSDLYKVAKLNSQAEFTESVKKQNFPDGKWVVSEAISKLYAEKDPLKKEELLAALIKRGEKAQNFKLTSERLNNLKSSIPGAYAQKNDWEGFKKALSVSGINGEQLLTQYYYHALSIVRKNDSSNYRYAEEFARIAATEAKKQWQNPTIEKPVYMSRKQWDRNRAATYARNADVYAQVLYKTGEYKKGHAYAKDAALIINKGNLTYLNQTYALLAEKALPEKQYKKELEVFVINAKTTPVINDILKRLYIKQNKSEAGFEEYWIGLQNANYNKFLAELSKEKLDLKAPHFELYDLDGKKIELNELKNKIVVLDFWATWCAPCIASFPAMQRVIEKYKDDPEVKFLFVDTWEKGDNKTKKVTDFMSSKKYSFHVLLDSKDEVVKDYRVSGIPTKFVIDKNGIIRFKSVDFKQNEDEKLINELTAMIEIARDQQKTYSIK